MEDSQYKINIIKIGLKISYYRKLRGMTQQELAEASGCSPGYMSQIEGPNCFFCPSLRFLFSVSEALNVPVYKFLDIEDD